MLDSFNVIIDTITDLLDPIFEIAYPFIIAIILVAIIIFAWKSTEVTTDDEVRGQFTIPGLRTFNVVTDNRQLPDENRNIRRRNIETSNRHDMTSETDTDNNQTSDRQTENPDTRTEVEHEAGDLSEAEVNINVRYLDESVMNCSFRPSQSLGHFKLTNWSDADERGRVCLIFAGKALRDDRIVMARIGIKEGDTMHAFYKNNSTTESNSTSTNSDTTSATSTQNNEDDEDFDELARYFLPLAGSLLIMTWFYVLSSPVMMSVSTLMALLFITSIYTGFAIYNYRSLIF
jgi:hypothetical protein